jgi:hypothetical protein
VCDGRGNVPAGFYLGGGALSDTNSELCRACEGRGILWQMPFVEPREKS